MRLLKKAKEEGLSLRTTFILMLIVSIVITAILLVTTLGLIRSFHALSEATDAYIELQDAASSLMRASDYLTEEAQCYTVSGERKHLDNYFMEAEERRTRESAIETMEQIIPDSQALEELKASMNESLALMEREFYAMRLVLTAQGDADVPPALQDVELTEQDKQLSAAEKKALAAEMLHDDEYYAKKTLIRMHQQKCTDALKSGTHGTQKQTEEALRRDLVWTTIMIVLQSLGFVLTLTLTTKLGINPLLSAVDHIKQDQSLPIMGAVEFRYLAGTYNKMYAAYKKSVENLSFKASHDKLTGVYNRAGYDLIKQSVDLNTTAFLLLDTDCFKEVNDSCGHEVGDRTLQKIARTIKNRFRADDYVCRVGGDEFVVMMVHVDETAKSMIERKVREINEELSVSTDEVPPVSLSAGVSLCSQSGDAQQVFHEADMALYYVKEHGKKGCCFYTPEIENVQRAKRKVL